MNLSEIYEEYDKVKSEIDYIEYRNEISTNNNILRSNPFDEYSAIAQLDYLVRKYKKEINAFAILHRNGKTTSSNSPKKPPQEIWKDLDYVNSLIPLFALERTGKSFILKNIIKQIDNNFSNM